MVSTPPNIPPNIPPNTDLALVQYPSKPHCFHGTSLPTSYVIIFNPDSDVITNLVGSRDHRQRQSCNYQVYLV